MYRYFRTDVPICLSAHNYLSSDNPLPSPLLFSPLHYYLDHNPLAALKHSVTAA